MNTFSAKLHKQLQREKMKNIKHQKRQNCPVGVKLTDRLFSRLADESALSHTKTGQR